MRKNPWRGGRPVGATSVGLLSWLTESGSLTARCQRNSREFRVRLLRAGRGRPLAAAGLPNAGRALRPVRDVVLECDGVPVIFAHTVLCGPPRGRLGRWLAGLGSRSLGSLLFSYPGFRRGPIECRRIDARDPLLRLAAPLAPAASALWARRSLHSLGRQQVLVCEVFLPAIADLGG